MVRPTGRPEPDRGGLGHHRRSAGRRGGAAHGVLVGAGPQNDERPRVASRPQPVRSSGPPRPARSRPAPVGRRIATAPGHALEPVAPPGAGRGPARRRDPVARRRAGALGVASRVGWQGSSCLAGSQHAPPCDGGQGEMRLSPGWSPAFLGCPQRAAACQHRGPQVGPRQPLPGGVVDVVDDEVDDARGPSAEVGGASAGVTGRGRCGGSTGAPGTAGITNSS